jgi:hypothetical protein
VTGGTATGYSGVVKFHPDRETCRARMAHLARRDGRDVGRRLANGNRRVVASRTGRRRGDFGMLDKPNISPKSGLMARPAII